ncbi:MAG: bifunctional precorrin-2 dehydrogenase/sirohydrochlorin ferrochelatase, partial [Metallosphaera sp.]
MLSQVHHYFPIFLDLTNVKVLVIGGGKVGSKRASKFRDYGAEVTVVSLDFSEDLATRNDIIKVKLDASILGEEFLSKYDIIITATSDQSLNSRLCSLGKSLKKFCNNPTNPNESSFIVPIFYEDDDVGIAVTTMGKSSIMSKVILDKALEALKNDPKILLEIKVMNDVKSLLKSKIKDPSIRYNLYHKIFIDKQFES